ncbi:MAG: hypothetical protein J6T40_00375 [Clostridiales bacterium]|nr:hypothetical protein [Clostridiales bacterium]
MITDAKKALKEAQEKDLLTPFEPDGEMKKQFFSGQRKQAVKLFFYFLALLVVAVLIAVVLVGITHIVVYSARIIFVCLLIVLLPLYGIYNIFSLNSAIKKGDYEFYLGDIVEFYEDKYKVRGLENGEIQFLKKPSDPTLGGNTRVIVARLKDELSLIEYRIEK